MPDSGPGTRNLLAVYLLLAQYPILAREIRHRMRDELYRRGIISPARLEAEAREQAALSQQREGLTNPLVQENARQWEQRLDQIRDHLTDVYFANHLPLDSCQHLVQDAVAQRSTQPRDAALTFNPELAPLDLLLKQAERYEALPEAERAKIAHHLEEIRVVLIRTLIVDQLAFVHVAKDWFTADDFRKIDAQRIGTGKIGGKAGGMLLAWKILQVAAPGIAKQITIPRSYYIGADVFYDFLALNGLEYINQKYKPAAQIRAEYPQIQEAYERGRFPEEIADQLRDILRQVGPRPLVVRSSSRLEDSFGTSFAGMYASCFCPNQGTPKENLRDLTLAIRRVYASVYNPDVLLYRRRVGLLDYDERMAVHIQEVQGQTFRRYFFPTAAGVAFSHTPIAWSRRLRREEGFMRLVVGLGTRAVGRVADDYPRLVTLSHPLLRPEVSPADIRRFSQHHIDLIDLEHNVVTTLPVRQVLDRDLPSLWWLASLDRGDAILPLFSLGPEICPERLVLTFDNLLQRSDLVPLVRNVLSTLASHYHAPVDVEFAITLDPGSPQPRLTFHLLQCRPQSRLSNSAIRPAPRDLGPADEFFVATRMVPLGQVSQIEYIIYVYPAAYQQLTATRRTEIARLVGRLNRMLEGQRFILMGPGRWGSSDASLGVPVTYGDLYNALALVELAFPQQGSAPEPSYGTHFFQDLVEAQIYPLALCPDEPGDSLNRAFIEAAKDQLTHLLPDAAAYATCVKVIHVPTERAGNFLHIVMDGDRALAYFAPLEPAPLPSYQGGRW
jgi:hypothetical protein